MAQRVPKGSGGGGGGARFDARGPLVDTSDTGAPTPGQAPQKVSQWGQELGNVLHTLAAALRAKGDELISVLGNFVANLAGPQFGPVISGLVDVVMAISGNRKSHPVLTEIVNEPTVHLSQSATYTLGENPASPLYGGRGLISGGAVGTVDININEGPGVRDLIRKEVTGSVRKLNVSQNRRG